MIKEALLAVLAEVQVKGFQRKSKTGKAYQVSGFERGQAARTDPQAQAARKQQTVQLKSKMSSEERATFVNAAKAAKKALSKGSSKSAIDKAKKFYALKNQFMRKYSTQKQRPQQPNKPQEASL